MARNLPFWAREAKARSRRALRRLKAAQKRKDKAAIECWKLVKELWDDIGDRIKRHLNRTALGEKLKELEPAGTIEADRREIEALIRAATIYELCPEPKSDLERAAWCWAWAGFHWNMVANSLRWDEKRIGKAERERAKNMEKNGHDYEKDADYEYKEPKPITPRPKEKEEKSKGRGKTRRKLRRVG